MPRCPEHPTVELTEKKRGWHCSACDDVVVTYDEHPAGASSQGVDLASSLPTLLALPLVELGREPTPVLALWAACDLVELALKLAVMAGVAEHERLPESLVRALRDRVELPTMGKWLGMAVAVAEHLPATSPLGVVSMAKSLEGLLGPAGASPEGGLLALRNRLAHGGPVPRAEAARLAASWKPRLLSWAAEALAWLGGTALVAVDAGGKRILLRGPEGRELDPSLEAELAGLGRVPPEAPAGSVWLLAGGRALPLGPLAAFEPSQRAPLVYVRRGEVRLQYLRLGDEGGLLDSEPGALERFRALFLGTPAAEGPRRFTIRDFGAELRKESSRRVGRDAEVATLTAAVRGLSEGALWVSGPAGIGKSNLLASVAEELLEHPPAGALVLPYRFRAGDDRCGRSPFLAYLRERLEASDALSPIEERPAREGEDRGTPPLVDPVQEVQQLIERLRPDRRLLLVVDGLDEVVERDPRFVPDVLFRLLGERVALAAAGRPERGLPEAFAQVGAVTPFPAGLPPMGEDDVRALLLERIGPARRRLLARDKESAGLVHNAFITAVASHSEGLPIYVSYVLGDLNTGRLQPEHPEALPAGLHAYHDELLRRSSVGDLQAVTTPTLVLLALAHEPLTVAELAALLVRRGTLDTANAGLVERGLQVLGAMVRRAPGVEGEDGFTLYHHSLRTHVAGSPELRETVASTRSALGVASLTPAGDEADAYLYRCGVRHLLDAGRATDALAVLTDFELLMSRFLRLEPTGRAAEEWYADWERVRPAVGKLEGDARVWWDSARTSRHLFRKEGWEPWRVLFQAAMDHADDSAVTRAAEAFEASGRRDWAWLRWVNRPKAWRESPCVAVLVGHVGAVRGATELADGRILSWSWDGTLRLWSAESGAPLATLRGHTGPVRQAMTLPDGRILSCSDDGRLRVWDGPTGAAIGGLEGHTSWVVGADVLSDGRILSWSQDATLRLWEGSSGAPLAALSGHADAVSGAGELADGRILSWSRDGTLRLWEGLTGALVAALVGHTDSVTGARVLPDDRILSWSYDHTLRVWDGATGELIATLKGHTKRIVGAMVLCDSRILSWSEDGTLRLWAGSSCALAATLEGHTKGVVGATMLCDSRILSWSEDGTLRVWEGSTGAPLATLEGHTDQIRAVSMVSGGRILSCSEDGSLRLWDGLTGAPLATLEGHTNGDLRAIELADGRFLSWSHDGTLRVWDGSIGAPLAALEGHTRLLSGARVLGDGRALSWSWDGTLRLWDSSIGAAVAILEGHTGWVNEASVLCDGRILSWSWNHGTLRLWDGSTGAPLAVLEGHSRWVNGAAVVLPDRQILSWSWDGTLRLWESSTGAPLAILEGHTKRVLGGMALGDGRILSWSQDGTLRLWDGLVGVPLVTLEGHKCEINGASVLADARILSWSDDRTLRLWDGLTGAPLSVLEGHTKEVVGALELADGRILSWSEDRTLSLWDGSTGAAIAVLEGHTGSVARASALSDGRLLSWSYDGTLRLWDGSTGAPLAVLDGHTRQVVGARVLSDGRILSWSYDGTLRLWDGRTGAPLAVFASPRDWRGASPELAKLRPGDRAVHHSLHTGFTLQDADAQVAVFTGGRHLRICHFVPERTQRSTGADPRADGPRRGHGGYGKQP